MADTATLTRRIIVRLLLGGLVILSFTVLRMFLVPVAWAAILAYATWPPYQWLRRILRGSATASAVVMIFFLTAAVVLPMLWLVAMARTEMANAYAGLADYLERVTLSVAFPCSASTYRASSIGCMKIQALHGCKSRAR